MNQIENLLTTVEINEAVVGIRKDGIIHVYYKSGITLDVKLQNKLMLIFDELSKGEKKKYIYEAGKNVRITREARINATTEDKSKIVLAAVVVAKSWYQKVIANFYYKLSSKGTIYKVVTDFSEGIEWLHLVNAGVAV